MPLLLSQSASLYNQVGKTHVTSLYLNTRALFEGQRTRNLPE